MNNRTLNIGIALIPLLSFGFAFSMPVMAADIHVYESESIQTAIDSAVDGDVIYVHEGLYEENIVIDNVDVSLIAVGDVTIQGTNTYASKTIAVYNAKCTIDGFTVKHGGSAIYARGMASYGDSEVDVTIMNIYVTDYIKNGITVNGELATGLVKDNAVESDADSVYAQNGIQFGYGATGHILGNAIFTDWYLGEDWTASGILIFESDKVSAIQNYISNAQTGIAIETWGWFCPSASKNIIVDNTIENSDWGISVTALSWKYSEMHCFANNNKITNNVVTADDEDIGIIGIYIGEVYVDGDYTPEADNNKTINNTISGFESDIVDEGFATKVHANRFPLE